MKKNILLILLICLLVPLSARADIGGVGPSSDTQRELTTAANWYKAHDTKYQLPAGDAKGTCGVPPVKAVNNGSNWVLQMGTVSFAGLPIAMVILADQHVNFSGRRIMALTKGDNLYIIDKRQDVVIQGDSTTKRRIEVLVGSAFTFNSTLQYASYLFAVTKASANDGADTLVSHSSGVYKDSDREFLMSTTNEMNSRFQGWFGGSPAWLTNQTNFCTFYVQPEGLIEFGIRAGKIPMVDATGKQMAAADAAKFVDASLAGTESRGTDILTAEAAASAAEEAGTCGKPSLKDIFRYSLCSMLDFLVSTLVSLI